MNTVQLIAGLKGGQWYAWWSGLGSDIPLIAMVLLRKDQTFESRRN